MRTIRFHRIRHLACAAILLALASLAANHAGSAEVQYATVFREISDTIRDYFYDGRFVKERFGPIRARYADKAAAAQSQAGFASVVNAMLGELGSSHTHYYVATEPEYYQLVSTFAPHVAIQKLTQGNPLPYPSIGVHTERRDGKIFVVTVFEGGPADKAGIVKGDEILSVDGQPFAPVMSFQERVAKPTKISVRRRENSPPMTFKVVPAMADPKEEFLTAERTSVRVLKAGARKIGYIHILSYASEQFHSAFLDALAEPLKDADALIWDLRDGWGGADTKYLNVFNKQVPVLTLAYRGAKPVTYEPQWRKPVVMLVNGRVRSGKEVLAYAFRKYGLGKVIGERTAGAVLAGTPFVVSDKSILYLAVGGARVDGEILEGGGVEPDILVPMKIEYLAGNDLQLKKALEYLERSSF